MKLLLDSCVWGGAKAELQELGIVRLVGSRARQQASACAAVVAGHGDELLQGAIATASSNQVRLRPA